jgi:hypothetical protein
MGDTRAQFVPTTRATELVGVELTRDRPQPVYHMALLRPTPLGGHGAVWRLDGDGEGGGE